MLTKDTINWLFDLLLKLSTPPEYPMAEDFNLERKRALLQLTALMGEIEDTQKIGIQSYTPDILKRTVFLSFSENSKVIMVNSKKPTKTSGRISVEVTVNIPKALFHTTELTATVDLPNSGLSQEAMVDIKQALTMAYGNTVNLVVQPSEPPN